MCLALALAGCATAPPSQTSSAAPTYRARPGNIESIVEVEEHVPSDPVDDALVIVLIGGLLVDVLLFHHGTGSVVGADNGTLPSTAPEGDSSTLPSYRVLVRFDDGGSMTLEYRGEVPFDRGERVVLTDQGLVRTYP